MDSIPDRQFLRIFKRVSTYVDFKGCKTPEDVEKKMQETIASMRRARQRADNDTVRKKLTIAIKRYLILLREGVPSKYNHKTRVGFQTWLIHKAKSEPTGKIALTLKYGRRKAEEIIQRRESQRRERYFRELVEKPRRKNHS